MPLQSDPKLVELATSVANSNSLEPALVCAIIEQESGWDPWATRYEPRFQVKYIDSLHLDWIEAHGRATSFGLMQCMGEVLRELGYKGTFGAFLDDPVLHINLGCKHFLNKLHRADGKEWDALQFWNGGGNPQYANQVIARKKNYAKP